MLEMLYSRLSAAPPATRCRRRFGVSRRSSRARTCLGEGATCIASHLAAFTASACSVGGARRAPSPASPPASPPSALCVGQVAPRGARGRGARGGCGCGSGAESCGRRRDDRPSPRRAAGSRNLSDGSPSGRCDRPASDGVSSRRRRPVYLGCGCGCPGLEGCGRPPAGLEGPSCLASHVACAALTIARALGGGSRARASPYKPSPYTSSPYKPSSYKPSS